MAQLTPMLAQYQQIKAQYTDAILFYRMGDFYEMFSEDAVKAAPILEVQLTSRDRNSPNPMAMCGVPFHSATQYIQKLLDAGLKVAICEQVEDPSQAKGLVKREVIRVLTPSLIGDPELAPENSRQWLCALATVENGIDISVLELFRGSLRHALVQTWQEAMEILSQYQPKEILYSATLLKENDRNIISKTLPSTLLTLRDSYFAIDEARPSITAIQSYLKETQKLESVQLTEIQPIFDPYRLRMDATTVSSLELLGSSVRDNGRPTLFTVLNQCLTAMGRRGLKDELINPPCNLEIIERRLNFVEELIQNSMTLSSLQNELTGIRDLERLATKTSLRMSLPRDVVSIREILKKIPAIKNLLSTLTQPLSQELNDQLQCLNSLTEELELALEDSPPHGYRDGGIIRESYHQDVAELRSLSTDSKALIAALEARERDSTRISSLKIKYNRVYGYSIEVTKTHLEKVPPHYIRKQTIANAERYITDELKTLEDKISSAEKKLKALEEETFLKLRERVVDATSTLLVNSAAISRLDILMSFAITAKTRGYVKPRLHTGLELNILDGRHAVLETLLDPGEFVPNTVEMDPETCRTLLITGPNMGGKSTIMRQVALITVMAHLGSFVPAKQALIPLTDAIFTRIGSSDDLVHGQSTFMVEMSEVSRILEGATLRSLILIDEIGRGTSTYDGLALAWSILEYIHQSLRCKTLFATHFHELTLLEETLPGFKNANVLVKHWKGEIIFLHQLAFGICPKSYGVDVAKLAGLPSIVLLRAKDIQGHLETQSQKANRNRHDALKIFTKQIPLFEESETLETGHHIES